MLISDPSDLSDLSDISAILVILWCLQVSVFLQPCCFFANYFVDSSRCYSV